MHAPDDIYRIPDTVVTREIVGETLLIPISGDLADMDNIFALNDTGAFIWARLNGETRLTKINTEMCETFAVEAEQAWQDLHTLIGELKSAGLVEQII